MEVETYQPLQWYRVTLTDGEPLKESLAQFAIDESIEFGWIQVVGEIKDGKIAAGYGESDPDQKLFETAVESRHVLGVGSIRWTGNDEDHPDVHVHGPVGRERETLTGCWAQDPQTFRGLEILVAKLA